MYVEDLGDRIRVERTVAFGDCDPAGIAYTGKIIGFALEAIDAFWKVVTDGRGWYEMNLDHGMGTPFVNVDVDFLGPITPRAPLICEVRVLRLGNTSIVLEVKATTGEREAFVGRFTCVFVSTRRMKKQRPPDWIAHPIERFLSCGSVLEIPRGGGLTS